MKLGELIQVLEYQHPAKPVRYGFCHPISYRGDYSELAFQPCLNTTVGAMLDHARSALNKTFEGYKGGDFFMDAYTPCWVANYGTTEGAEPLSHSLLSWMLEEDLVPTLWQDAQDECGGACQS